MLVANNLQNKILKKFRSTNFDESWAKEGKLIYRITFAI